MARWDFRSIHPDEVQEFLGGVYTENEFKLLGKGAYSKTRIHGGDLGDIAQYNVSYSSPFTFVSDTDRDSFLILSCTGGSGQFRRGADLMEFHAGLVGPISATQESRVKSGETLAHISTHIGSQAIQNVCSRLVGHSLDKPVLFAHSPFSDDLKAHWDLVVRSFGRLLGEDQVSSLSVNSLQEHAITILLEKHPHNYSRFLQDNVMADSRLVKEAKHYIQQNADKPITIADVSRAVGCSMRALHQGFCELVGVTPRAYLHFSRMARVREKLQTGEAEHSAAEIAGKWGFSDFESFSSAYKRRYDEDPNETFSRNLGASAVLKEMTYGARAPLTPAKIDLLRHHINTNIGNQITVQKLASLVGMSAQNFASAFKNAFRTTPAQYVLSERLNWASWLLANTSFSIAAIAAETGFSSQSHLTAAMGKASGQTPYEFRRLSNLR